MKDGVLAHKIPRMTILAGQHDQKLNEVGCGACDHLDSNQEVNRPSPFRAHAKRDLKLDSIN